ncbi:hypothetical protein ABZ342_24825 [Amycolatopsis sp. NPDC005961]|uniref:hypothetical protein n=1 Tax=Amycolatopsis sp. NPDC005961 TaxID=3156720 RepID=UPI0033FE57D2
MSDDDRDQLISGFWDFVTDGLDVHPGYLERLRSRRPHLPEEPSTEQLEAWIELAEIVRDDQFRTALRAFLHRAFGTEQGKLMATPEMLAHAERQRVLYLEAQAAQQAGVPADSPQARDIAERMAADSADFVAAMTGDHDLDKARRSMAGFDRIRSAEARAKMTGTNLMARYSTLVAVINGTPQPDPEKTATVQEWMASALRRDPT